MGSDLKSPEKGELKELVQLISQRAGRCLEQEKKDLKQSVAEFYRRNDWLKKIWLGRV